MPANCSGTSTCNACTPHSSRITSPSTRVSPKVTIRKALWSRRYSRRSRPISNDEPTAPAISGPTARPSQKLPVSRTVE